MAMAIGTIDLMTHSKNFTMEAIADFRMWVNVRFCARTSKHWESFLITPKSTLGNSEAMAHLDRSAMQDALRIVVAEEQ
ncbi:hypothetical protein Pla52n_50520 [Stieleria varia]|uniref:Uncharacterized protein n=1 Tax=Stieleria varia TaxID=2528005 RepID=A0A5C6AGK9_9BACT|nr:hypothetical protein Pla52n_50520 [Stieleria varia]